MPNEPYRSILVYYDDDRQIGFRTQRELEDLAGRYTIQHVIRGRERLTAEEIGLYVAYLRLKTEKGSAPSNLELVKRLAQAGIALSRNEVARERKSIGKKLGYKGGW